MTLPLPSRNRYTPGESGRFFRCSERAVPIPIEDMERQVRQLARERLGYEELRPGQLEAVTSVVNGRDTLCVMSTGSGKSAIYQPAGFVLDGPTVVVSPLIALQQDQMEAVEEDAAGVNPPLAEKQRDEGP